MNKKITKDFYSSPLVKVKELQARQMLCGSPLENGLQTFDREEWGEE